VVTDRRVLGIIWLLVLALSGLTPLADASPPDPSWVRGMYDDADGDDVVVLATSATAAIPRTLLADFKLSDPLIGPAPGPIVPRHSARSVAPRQTRAPPAP